MKPPRPCFRMFSPGREWDVTGVLWVNDSTKMPENKFPFFVVTTEKPWNIKRRQQIIDYRLRIKWCIQNGLQLQGMK